MSDENYDPLDWSTQRAASIAFRDHIKEIIESALGAPVLTDEDRKALEISKTNLYSFDELDKMFVAPLAAKKPSRATHRYEMLWLLMSASFYAGSRGTITDSGVKFADIKLRSSRGSEGWSKQRRAAAGQARGLGRQGADLRPRIREERSRRIARHNRASHLLSL
jgi:alanyl-tRNA synthetase